jgi:hypothetical protein
MPIRGMDPMGADFADRYHEWVAAGRPFYAALPVKTAWRRSRGAGAPLVTRSLIFDILPYQ